MPFHKELSHLIEEQINRAVDHKTASVNSAAVSIQSGGEEGRIAQLEANLQKLGEKFTNFISSQKNNKKTVVDYGLNVIALHGLRLAVTAGRAIFVDLDEPVEVPYTYLQLQGAGTERQIRYIYLDSTGVVSESSTDPTNIGTGYIPLAMIDVWTGVLEITQDKIKDIRPRIGNEDSTALGQNHHELNGNVTLYSPDTGNDSFVVAAASPAGLRVIVSAGRALVSGEMLNAEGGPLDLANHCKVINEFIAFSDGVTRTYHLYHKSVANVIVYVNDVASPVDVDAANGSISLSAVPVPGARITASYTFSGNYMLLFLVERAETNDGKPFGVINWKAGTNRNPAVAPELSVDQHAIAKVDMSSSITAITDALIDNGYEVRNLTQYDLQYGGRLQGSSLKAGAVSLEKLDSSMQGKVAAIDGLKTELDTAAASLEDTKKFIRETQADVKIKYTELTQATSELERTDQLLTSTIAGNKTELEGKLNNAVSQITQTTDGLWSTVIANEKDAGDKEKAAEQQISQIQQSVNTISSTVAANKADTDSQISTIKQTVDGISSTVSSNKMDADDKISILKQTADGLTSSVASNKTDMEGKLSAAVSQIKQTTDSITSTISNVNTLLAASIAKGNVYIRGTGLNRNANRQISLNDHVIVDEGSGRGLRLVVINRNDLSVRMNQVYDVYGAPPDITNLISTLDSLNDAVLVVLASWEAIRIPLELANVIARCGGSGTVFEASRLPYAFIGIPNIGKGLGIEVITSDDATAPYAEISTKIVNGVPQGINTVSQSQIIQQAGRLTSIITELDKPIGQCSYTAISQAKEAINLCVKSSDYNGQSIVSQINVSPAGTLIDGKMLHVTGKTIFDDDVIVGSMLQSGSVTTAKISTGAINADKIATGSVTAEKVAAEAITADKIAAGAVTAEKIAAGTITANTLGVTELSAITAKIGTLRTAATGARTEIKDNLILVYDSNNKLRVRMGIW